MHHQPRCCTAPQGSGLEHMNELNAAYQALYFVLYFPRGEPGWHPDMLHRGASDVQECSVEEAAVLEDEAHDQHDDPDAHPKQHQRLTSREWIAYHTHVRHAHAVSTDPVPGVSHMLIMPARATTPAHTCIEPGMT
jgi:hypothetical protein